MAQSLDGLIEHLLEEIALSGEKGVQLSDIVKSVTTFYQQPTRVALPHDHQSGPLLEPAPSKNILVDRHFLACLWKWLANHPDVLLGKDGQYNTTSLADIERRYAGCVSHALNYPRSAFFTSSNVVALEDDSLEAIPTRIAGPTIYVTRGRMYLAICGHLPDSAKVFPSEWTLLSHIAASRNEGILQGELGRATGQDKRSVPKRTDQLQRKGYVIKRTVYVKGTKTSRLFLRRFAFEHTKDATSSGVWKPVGVEKLTLKYQCNQMFAVLMSNPLISQDQLAESLEMTSQGRQKVFSLMIRHFGRVGCIKRVKTAFGPFVQSEDLQICVQYLREPGDADLEDANDDGINFNLSLDELAKPYENSEVLDPANPVDDVPTNLESGSVSPTPSTRVIPQWNPDRILANVLYEAAKQAGGRGMKNIDARRTLTGPFVKRILESLLIKISHQSLQSQPAGLKHLTVVRSKEADESVLQYVHYAIQCFEENVRDGKATWDDINGGLTFLKQLDFSPTGFISDLALERDSFGFPSPSKDTRQVRGGEATQSELLRLAKIKDVLSGSRILSSQNIDALDSVMNEDEPLSVKPVAKRGRPRKVISQDANDTRDDHESGKTVRKASTGQVIRGRPRKFLRGTEKFWRDMFVAAVRQEDPDYVRTMGTGGVMKSEAGMRVFLARPDNFDEVLLRVMEAGLPVPKVPQDISNKWVDNSLAILDMPRDGLYFTSVGVQQHARAKLSKIMVVKSARLQTLDFNDRQKVWDWQSLSSSASHSLRYKPYYPTLGPSAKKSGFVLRQPKLPRAIRAPQPSGPPRGTFFEDRRASDRAHQPRPLLAESESIRIDPSDAGLISESTDTDPDLPDHIAQAEAESAPGSPDHSPQETRNARQNRVSPILSPNQESPSALPRRPTRNRKPTEKAAQSLSDALVAPKIDSTAPKEASEGADDARTPQERVLLLDTFDSVEELSLQRYQAPSNTTERDFRSRARSKSVDASKASPVEEEEPIHRNQSQQSISKDVLEERERSASATPIVRDESRVDNENAEINTSQSPVLNGIDDERSIAGPSANDERISAASTSNIQSKKRPVQRDWSDESDVVRPPKRAKRITPSNRISQREPARLCRNIIYDLIKLCSGMAPSDSWTFRRAILARWAESGTNLDPPSAKNVRTNLKALAKGAKVRHITFAYKKKTGEMGTKSIIALRKFDSTHEEVLKLQKKMVDADPQDYVPPEMVAEFDRTPSTFANWRPTLDDSESDTEESEIPQTPRRSSVIPRVIQNRQHSGSSDDEDDDGQITSTSLGEAFVTLRIPALHTLSLPAELAVQYNAPGRSQDTEAENAMQPFSGRQVTTRRGLRKRRTTRFDAETHNIIWVDHQRPAMPSSLDEIPNIQISRDEAAISGQSNPLYARFIAEVECVAAWEERTLKTLEGKAVEIFFINHAIMQTDAKYLPLQNGHFGKLVRFDAAGEAYETILPTEQSWKPFVNALNKHSEPSAPPIPILRQKRKYTKRKKSVSFINDEDDDDDFQTSMNSSNSGADDDADRKNDDDDDDEDHNSRSQRTPAKRRRSNNPQRTSKHRRKAGTEKSSKPRKFRRPVQVLRYMPADMQYQLVVSIIIIRTLAGGVEKYIDWRLVQRLIPSHETEHVQIAWKSLLGRHRPDINGLTESLQEKYLDALAEGKVPSVNFDNLNDTDWEGILTWALTNLKKFQTEKVDELPVDKNLFYRNNHVTTEEPEGIRNSLGFGILTSQNRKDELMGSLVFATRISSLTRSSIATPSTEPTDDPAIIRAKSWVISLLLTPEATFDPQVAHRALFELADTPAEREDLVDKALSLLQRDKVISKGRDNTRPAPIAANNDAIGVRTWEINIKYHEQFTTRRQITGSMLKAAAKYKLEVLDVAFSGRQQPLVINPDFVSDDGEMIAIINLLAMGAVTIRAGDDLPDTRYGLGWEKQGYSTRLIDKSTLSFSVVLEAVEHAYLSGDPLDDSRSRVVIPRGSEVSEQITRTTGRIPPWFDINLDFLPEMWDMFMGAIIGLISIRPGADAKELSRSTSNSLGEWEISLIVSYLERLGAIRKTTSGHGYETEAWWWMSLAATEEAADD